MLSTSRKSGRQRHLDELGSRRQGTKKETGSGLFLVPLAVVFSNLLLEGIERLWEVHKILPNPKHFPLAAEDSVS